MIALGKRWWKRNRLGYGRLLLRVIELHGLYRAAILRMLFPALCAALAVGAYSGEEAPRGMSYLDNGTIKIGANLDLGGAITYLAVSANGQNLINSYDWGRQIQMSHYSGPVPFVKDGKQPKKEWEGLGWNPIQSGDCFGHRSRVLEHHNDKKTIYVKSVPMQWPLENVPGECTFEWWIALDGAAAKVRSRVSNQRPDKEFYSARGQELPAVYTNGPWYRLVTYMGDRPYEDQPVTVLTRKGDGAGWPWLRFQANERWAALLDEKDWGLGIFHPDALHYAGGFAGPDSGKGNGGEKNAQTGYVSPIHNEILDHDIVYENRFDLVVGTLREIRSYAYAQPRPEKAPRFRFDKDRCHWRYENAKDGGFPVRDALQIDVAAAGAALVSPDLFWQAADAPVLYVEAAFTGGVSSASAAFAHFGEDDRKAWDQWGPKTRKPYVWPEALSFPVTGDGKMRIYEVKLSARPDYRGAMRALRLNFPASKEPCNLRYIGFIKPIDEPAKP